MKILTLTVGAFALVVAATTWADVAALPQQSKANQPAAKQKKTGATSMAVGSGVTLSYSMGAKPQVGMPLTISLEMTGVNDANVVLSAGDGLTLDQPSQELKLLAGQKMQHTITVVPQAEGLLYVNAFIKSKGRASSTAIPVQVGAVDDQQKARSNAAAKATLQEGPRGERTISVPAK